MWRDTWFLAKRDLYEAKKWIILYFLGAIVAFLLLGSTLYSHNELQQVLGEEWSWDWLVTILQNDLLRGGDTLSIFVPLLLLYLPNAIKHTYDSSDRSEVAQTGEKPNDRAFTFLRPFSIDPRAMIYSRSLSVFLVGSLYFVAFVPPTWIAFKKYEHLTDYQITGIVLLILTIGIFLHTILLYMESTQSESVFTAVAAILFFVIAGLLYLMQQKFHYSPLDLAITIIDWLTPIGCSVLLLIAILTLYTTIKALIRRVALQ